MGKAYVWRSAIDKPEIRDVDNPETEIDGDLFWIWVGEDDAIAMSFERWEGQAQACVAHLIAEHPELAPIQVLDASPFNGGETLSDIAALTIQFADLAQVNCWFHGTSADRLDAILSEGLAADMPLEQRAWRVAEAGGHVYLAGDLETAASYAEHAAGGRHDEVVIEIDPAALEPENFRADHDFPDIEEGNAFRRGAYGDVSEVRASYHFTGRIGHFGAIPPFAIAAIYRKDQNGDWLREAIEKQLFLAP